MTMAGVETMPRGTAAQIAARLGDGVPRLTSARLVLRAPAVADFEAWAAIFCADRAVHMGGPFTRADAWAEFANYVAGWMLHGHGLWAVTARDGGTDLVDPDLGGAVLGFAMIGLEPADAEPELGVMLTAGAESRGYATEAARTILAHARDTLGWPRLVSYVASENARSVRLMQRLGARPDGAMDGATVWVHDLKEPRA